MYRTMDDLYTMDDFSTTFLNFAFSSTAVSTPSQSGSAKPGRGQLVYHMNNHLKYN